MESEVLLKLAGVSCLLAIPALILAIYFQGSYIAGGGTRYNSLADTFIAIMLLLMVLPVFGTYILSNEPAGSWLFVATLATIAGMIVSALGQFLLSSGVIKPQISYITVSIGGLSVFLWMVIIIVLTLGLKQLSQPIAWTTLAAFALIISIVTSWLLRKPLPFFSLGILATVTFVTWFGGLGWHFIKL